VFLSFFLAAALAKAAPSSSPVVTPMPAPVALVSHCQAGEVALFTSKMGMSTWNDMRTRKRLKGDKTLSLCLDRFPAPRRLSVRFGKLGAPDVDLSSGTTSFRISTQERDGGEFWTILSFEDRGLSWSVIQPEGGNARDVFLIMGRSTSFIARTEAIDEGEHWLRAKKKYGKKKVREVPLGLGDIPPTLAQRNKTVMDGQSVDATRFVANLNLPK
jgi:hypothetical protein